MKVVLFCGGLGTRLREYSETIPKPMVDIGPRSIIWHLMRYYAHFGHRDFVLCLGYRGNVIKDYFLNYNECLSNDFTLRKGGKEVELVGRDIEDWIIRFADTGIQSNIGQRLHAIRHLVEHEEMFLANYADGLSDLPLEPYIDDFRRSNAVAAFVAVRPSLSLSGVTFEDNGTVTAITYLNDSDVWINGGFFVLRPEVFDFIRPGEELVEAPFRRLIEARRLKAYRYEGFWSAMDTFKDKKNFDEMVERGQTPWRVWDKSHRN